jgi:two-component system chemotaxis sensor kinase CheA
MDMSKYIPIFKDESEKNIKEMGGSLLILEKEPANVENLKKMFRLAHTFKGMAGTMGFKQMVELTSEMESLIHKFRTKELVPDPFSIGVLLESLDTLKWLVENACMSIDSDGIQEQEIGIRYERQLQPDVNKILENFRVINSSHETTSTRI